MKATLNAGQQMMKAIIRSLREDTFFATIILGLKLIEHKSLPSKTVGTDGINLYYDPDFVMTHERDLPIIMSHEALHIVLMHHLRRMTLQLAQETSAIIDGKKWSFDAEAWQIACDCEVNDLLMDRADFPSYGVTAPKQGLPRGKLAEWYFSQLAKQTPESESSDSNGDGDPGEKSESGKSKTGKTGKTGSSSMGDVFAHPQATGDDVKDSEIVQDWQAMVTRCAISAREAGTLPGWMQEKLEKILRPAQVNWRTALRQFATETIKSGVRWSRPNRRMHHLESFTPDIGSRSLREIWMIEDTSGSMESHKWHPQVCGELEKIMSSYPSATYRYIQFDTRIVLDRVIKANERFPADLIEDVNGRGGTDINPVLTLARKLRPQAVIVLTDGAMPTPINPGVPVIWLMTDEVKMPFGKTIIME